MKEHGPDHGFDVVGLGVSTLDLSMVVEELPGGELVQRAHQSVLSGGGPVATAMVTLARLGSRTAMLDKVGDDWRGELIRSEFRREGVCADRVIVDPGQSSSIASILVRRRDGARAITYSPGSCQEFLPSDIPRDVIAFSRILHLNGRHFPACLSAATIARQQGVLVSFDGGANRYSPQMLELIRLADVCIVARQFARSFSGEDDLARSACALSTAGPKTVVITAGTEGSWVFCRGESFHQPAFPIDPAVDTTGAGDAYHGAFLYGLVNDYTLQNCAKLASAVGALNTRSLGGRTALPSLDQALAFLSDHGAPIF